MEIETWRLAAGQKLKKIIEEVGLNQTKLSQKSGVSQSRLSKIFKGDYKNIGHERIRRIAQAADLPIEQVRGILEGRDEHPPIERPANPRSLILQALKVMSVPIPIYDKFPNVRGTGMDAIRYGSLIPMQNVNPDTMEMYRVPQELKYLSPEIKPGDIITCDFSIKPEDFKEGELIAFDGGEHLEIGRVKMFHDVPHLDNPNRHIRLIDCGTCYKIVASQRGY